MQGFLLVNTEIVRDQLNIHKSVEPDGAHPRALQDVMAGPLFTTYQRPWQIVEVPVGWKVANEILI